MLNDSRFMDLAIERARERFRKGQRPIHCLIVNRDGRIVGEAGNTVARNRDPSAHAEVNAIRKACAALRTTDLCGCTLYTPMEPCPMCLSTILEAGIDRVVVGARHSSKAGRKDLGTYSMEAFLRMTRRRLEIVSLKKAECVKLRLAWLKRLSKRRLPSWGAGSSSSYSAVQDRLICRSSSRPASSWSSISGPPRRSVKKFKIGKPNR